MYQMSENSRSVENFRKFSKYTDAFCGQVRAHSHSAQLLN